MRWPHFLLLFLFAVHAPADEAAAPSAGAVMLELGGRFAPAERTAVRWQTRTEMTAGSYNGIRGIVPMEGKITKIDEREILTTYVPGGRREVLVVKGLTMQSETFQEKTEKKEKHQALEGVPVLGRQTDGKWSFAPAIGEPTAEQKPELDRLTRRANDEVDLFEGVKAKPGDTWDLDPVKFLKAAGFDDVTTAKGTAKATLKEIATMPGGPEAVIGLEIELRAQQTPAGGALQRLHLQYTGSLIRILATKLDRLVELEGRMSVGGEMVTGDGQRSPFTLVTPVKFRSQREIAKQ